MGGTRFVASALVALLALVAAQPAQADEIVDLEGATFSGNASVWSPYEGKVVTNGTFNLTSADNWTAGTYTIGDGAKVNCSGEFSFNGNYNLKIVGGEFNMTGGDGTAKSDPPLSFPLRYGQSTLLLDGGTLTSASARNYENRLAVNIGVIWNNKSSSSGVDYSAKAVLINNSTLSCTRGGLRISGTKQGTNKPTTSKTDFAVTNSTINLPSGQIEIGTNNNPADWLGNVPDSYARVVFGPGSDITCKQIWADKSITPEIKFDGATIHWVEGGASFIGHRDAIGDVYTIQSNGLTVDIPFGKSLSCDPNASSLKGEGGITKIGAGTITWNQVSSGGSAGMTFTGPLVVSNGTWTSTRGYAASAFKANGGTLALSGALSAANVALEATDGGTLTLSGATLTDTIPDLTLAGGGTTDFFTRDNAAATHTIGTLTLGESATLSLTGSGAGVDAVSVDTLVLSATTANKVALNFSDAANIPGGTYTNLTITGGAMFAVGDEAKFALDANAPEGSTLSVSGASLVLTVPVSNPATWTGGANDGKFSSTGNWLGNAVPGTSDNVVISVDSETTLDCDVALNVNSISFPQTSAKVRIEGDGSITCATTIANGSAARHVIDVPVEFVAAGAGAPIDVTGEVDFTGGVKGTLPVNHAKFYGTYHLTAESWEVSSPITLAANATVDAPGMTLHEVNTTEDGMLCSEAGARIVLGTLRRAEYKGDVFGNFAGEAVVGHLYLDYHEWYRVNANFTGRLRVGYIYMHSSSTEYFRLLSNGEFVLGRASGSSGIMTRRGTFNLRESDATEPLVLHSAADWNMVSEKPGLGNGYGFDIRAQGVAIDTSDFDGAAAGHTVSIKKSGNPTRVLSGAGWLSCFGNGTLRFEASCEFLGGLTASNSVTLAVNKDVRPGQGNVTLDGTATFDLVQSNSGTVPVSGTLTMAAGTTLKIPALAAGVLPLSVGALAFDGVTVENKVALSIDNSGSLADGVYAVLKSTADLLVDTEDSFAVPQGCSLRRSVDSKSLLLVVGTPVNTYIGSPTGSLSEGSNWLTGSVPTSGDALIYCASAATLTKGTVFAPESITFHAGCAEVTINGEGSITGIAAITNLSSASHTINVPVYFAGDIAVAQGARGYATRDNSHIVFAGGAYAADGYALASWNDGYSYAMFGTYWVAKPSSDPFTAAHWKVTTDHDIRSYLSPESVLHVPYAGAMTEIFIGTGSVLTNGAVSLTGSQRLCYRNYGEYVITNEMTVAGSDNKNGFAGHNAGVDASNVFKIEKATCNKTDGCTFYFAEDGGASTGIYYIGAGGINFGSGNGCFGIGNNADGDAQTVCPWYGDFTMDRGSGNTSHDMYCFRNITFNTDDESGVGRTITVNAILRFENTPTFTVAGSGKVLVNSAANNAAEPPVTVTNTATLAMKPGASLTTSNITVNANATLEVAESGTVTLGGGLSLADGAILGFNFTDRQTVPVLAVASDKTVTAEGAVKIAVSGKWPKVTGTAKTVTLTSGGKFTGKTVELVTDGKPTWAKRVDVVNGDIVLEVKPMAVMVTVK